MVAGVGFEPTTFGSRARPAARLLHPASVLKILILFYQSINKNGEIIDLQKLIIGEGYRPRRRIDKPISEIDVF